MLDGEDGFVRRKLVQRTAAERAAIVAESNAVGATVAGVALRHGVQPSQVSAWTSAARRKAEKRSLVDQPLSYAEIAVMPEPAPAPAAHDGIELRASSVVIRSPKSTPSKRVVEIARGVMAR